LYEQIGRLKTELEWMKKKLPPSAERKRPLMEIGHPALSVRRQYELLGLNRSSLYYEPAGEKPEDLRLMRLIDEQYTACPFYGSRRMTACLPQKGELVNRERAGLVRHDLGEVEPAVPKLGDDLPAPGEALARLAAS
jgi:putative transposase